MKGGNWLKGLLPRLRDRRGALRTADPLILVHYWDGSAPLGHGLGDISAVGAYIYTTERWYAGTVLKISLQVDEVKARDRGITMSAASVIVRAKVVRHGTDGVGVKFIYLKPEERQNMKSFLASTIPTASMIRPAPKSAANEGQSLVEFALILPFVFLLIIIAVNFGTYMFAWITIANAARTGVQYMVMSGASVGSRPEPTAAQVTSLVTNDISSLLNRSTLKVTVCTNNNGVFRPISGGSGSCTPSPATIPNPPSDPEAASYVLAAVDVTYTYKPFMTWSFTNLGINAPTLSTTTIHRRAVMRMIQ